MPRPFQETLHHINGGVLAYEVAEKLAELTLAVDATGKPGKVTLEITLRKSTRSTIAASGRVVLQKPKEPAVETLLFPTPEGALLTADPRQAQLPLKPVAIPGAEQLTPPAAA
jgi:hypothetical protein